MDWTELCVTVAAADTDRAAAIAAMAAPHGLYIEDYRDLEEGARQIAHSDLIDEEPSVFRAGPGARRGGGVPS